MVANYHLTGVRVLVIGGTSGLGLAMVRVLTAASAMVALTDRTAEAAKEVASGIPVATGFVADVRNQASVTGLVDAVWDAFGGIVQSILCRPRRLSGQPKPVTVDGGLDETSERV
ncbi:MAG: hypothetical protein NVS3B6_17970 [Pseudarthrobacter sp.]